MTQVITTVGDQFVKYLIDLGFSHAFGIPGGGLEPFLNSLDRLKEIGAPSFVCARHEAGAAFMADGYYRETGKTAIACATPGPGATNLVTGIASAYCDHVAMLVITPQVPTAHFGKGALQDSSDDSLDIVNMLEGCTKYSTLVSHSKQLVPKLLTAMTKALAAPAGPVHLSIPRDVLNAPMSEDLPSRLRFNLPALQSGYDIGAVSKLVRRLNTKPMCAIFMGSRCAGLTSTVVSLAERLNAPLVCSPAALRWAPTHHERYHGVFGFSGHESAKEAVASATDLVLAIGTSLSEWDSAGWDDLIVGNERLVFIDTSTEYWHRAPQADTWMFGNIQQILRHILVQLGPSSIASYLAFVWPILSTRSSFSFGVCQYPLEHPTSGEPWGTRAPVPLQDS